MQKGVASVQFYVAKYTSTNKKVKLEDEISPDSPYKQSTFSGRYSFLRWWGVGVFSILEFCKLFMLSQQTFLLSPASNLSQRGSDQTSRGMNECKSLKNI